ncbi:MAG: DUF2267 domain-containing protein [Chloroflexi bacterium]|nr:DUF2267 domain-containing protein [Chloroflexota bacterium]
MSFTGLEAFDTTVQKTNIWLDEVMSELGWDNRHKAYIALRAVLHALRDRLMPEEAVELGAQLPVLVRGFYYEGWKIAGRPIKYDRDEFFYQVLKEFPGEPALDVERVVRGVFRVLARRVDCGEVRDVVGLLPKGLRDLWENLCAVTR